MSTLFGNIFNKSTFFALFNFFGFIFIGIGLLMLLIGALSVFIPNNQILNGESSLTMGLIFSIIGSLFPLTTFLLTRKEKWFKKHGKLVEAQLESVLKEENGNRYRLFLLYKESGSRIEYRMISPYLLYNPTHYIEKNNITHFKVLIDPKNPDRYYFDRKMLALEEL